MCTAAACSSSTAPAAPLFGSYQLVSVQGGALPYIVDTAFGGQMITGGALTVVGADSAEMELGLGGALIETLKTEFVVRGHRLILWVPNRASPVFSDTASIDSAGVTVAHHWSSDIVVSLRFQR